MNMIKLASLIFSSLLLASCSTLQERQCETQDWSSHGRTLGLSGQGSESDELVKQCLKIGVSPKLDAFKAGYLNGLAEYCHPNNVLLAATAGENQDLKHCPAEEKSKLESIKGKGHKAHCTKAGAEARANNDKPSAATVCAEKFQSQYKKFYNKTARTYLRKALVTKRATWQTNQVKISQLDAKMATLNRDLQQAREYEEAKSNRKNNDLAKVLDLIPTATPAELESDQREVAEQREKLSKDQEKLAKEIAEKEIRLIDIEEI